MRSLGPEVTLFAGMATFGIVVGSAYWFLTYEAGGTILLSAFGLASALAAIAVFVGGRFAGRRSRAAHAAVGTPPGEPVPRPGWAPLGIALGLGGVALGAAFGPWLAIAGALVAVRSAKSWLDTAIEETDEARGLAGAGHQDEEPARDA